MRKTIANLPIKRKLFLIALFPSLLSLSIVSLFLLVLEISEFQQNAFEDLSAIASIIANRSTAAMLYDDKDLAYENLTVVETLTEVHTACIYDQSGTIFAQLLKSYLSEWACPLTSRGIKTKFNKTELSVVQPIQTDGEQHGTVYIHADLTAGYLRKIQFIGILFLVLIGVLVLTFFLVTPLLRLISVPIGKLVEAVKGITASHDYSIRAVKINNDELGVLVDSFNGLIHTVEEQNKFIHQAKDRYLMLYDGNPSIMFNVNQLGNILSVNQTCADQLGLDTNALHQHSIFDFIYTADIPLMGTFIERCILNPTRVYKQEFRQLDSQGEITWLRVAGKSVKLENQSSSLLLVCEDITEARELSERIAYQASHDALTGLANRIEFDRYVKEIMDSVYTENSEHVLCYMDLDQFKIVNDTYGHLAGDEFLRQLGDTLSNQIRHQDFIARLGGDEFGVLMCDCNVTDAYKLCERLRDVIRDFRFYWEGKSFSVGVSIGLTALNMTTGNVVNSFKEADSACYAAKEKGRNRIHIYSPDDEEINLRQGEMRWVEKIQAGRSTINFVCLVSQLC